jgi:hypothetical protein
MPGNWASGVRIGPVHPIRTPFIPFGKGSDAMKAIKQFIVIMLGVVCALAQSNPAAAQAKRSHNRRPSTTRATPAAFDDPALVKKYLQSISADSLRPHLLFLASDDLEGRETGTRGQKLAAEYLAKQYQSLGLSPKGTAKGATWSRFFQTFPLYPTTPQESRLEIVANGKPVAASTFSVDAHDDLAYYTFGNASSGSAGVVFVGYGIADDKLGYNDYAALAAKGISVDGKWLLMLMDEPMSDANTSLLPTAEHKLANWTTGFAPKRAARAAAGKPKGILVITDLTPRNPAPFAEAASLASLNARRIGPLTNFPNSYSPPTYNVSAKFANQLLAGSGQTIEAIKSQIDSTLKPTVFELDQTAVNAKVTARPAIQTENVLAFIEGSDAKLKNEVLVITAHYDHLGRNPLLKGDQIFNGAADDGSGVTASLELAKAFMAAKRDGHGSRRSILFLNTAGEEKGILGSYYFLNHDPVVPLDRIVADINMDGVAGIDIKHPSASKNYIYVGGAAGISDDLLAINRRMRETIGSSVELTDNNFPSDSVNFESLLIPYIYFSTGLTEHYHQVSDEASTIDYDHFARVVQLIFANAWQIANQDARIAGMDRRNLEQVGYVCPPCGIECDNVVHDGPGICPVCGMALKPKWETKK